MNAQIKNKGIEMTISTLGAEPQSLKKDGVEYIWQGDKEYWFRRAPLLFPLTGPTEGNKIKVDGKVYDMPNNGFARDTEFCLVSAEGNKAVFTLEESEKSLKDYYPFKFKLTVTYTLLEDGYVAKAEIDSKDNDIWFTYGWHPAFNLDMNGKGTDLESYKLTFSKDEKLDRRYQGPGNIFIVEKDFLVGNEIELTRKETDKGPLAFWNVKSDSVTLTSSKGPHGVKANLGSMDTFVSWTCAPKHGQYLCLEPMHSFMDASRNLEIKEMPGIIHLKAGEKKIFENTFNVF